MFCFDWNYLIRKKNEGQMDRIEEKNYYTETGGRTSRTRDLERWNVKSELCDRGAKEN